MRIRLSQLRRIIRETVEQVVQQEMSSDVDEMDELDEGDDLTQWDGSYSSGGAGGNRAGDSWSVGDDKESDEDFRARMARSDARWAEEEKHKHQDTRWD